MDQIEFRTVLLRAAFATMACDGHIDQREIDELLSINANTKYFQGVDFEKVLDELLADFKAGSGGAIKHVLEAISSCEMNPIQELLVLEVAIRIINSDQKHDENEVRFIHLLRSKLDLSNELIFDRFGAVPLLGVSEETRIHGANGSEGEISHPQFPDLDDSNTYDLSRLKSLT